MIKLLLMFIRKKWYFFLLISVLSFLMNFFVWNETTQYIRVLPFFSQGYDANMYELIYFPNAKTDGQIIDHSQAQYQEFEQLLSNFLALDSVTIYQNKTAYINNAQAFDLEKNKLSSDHINDLLKNKHYYIATLNDWLIMSEKEQNLTSFKTQAQQLSFKINFQTVIESQKQAKAYYFNNLLFGLSAGSLFLIVCLFVIHRLTNTYLTLFKEEIFQLRLLGLPQSKIKQSLLHLFCSQIILSFFLLIGLVSLLGMFPIWQDFGYLIVINLLVITITWTMINKKLRGEYFVTSK